MIDIEVAIESAVDNEGVGHSYAFWFHGMLLRVYEFAEVMVVEVRHFPLSVEVH